MSRSNYFALLLAITCSTFSYLAYAHDATGTEKGNIAEVAFKIIKVKDSKSEVLQKAGKPTNKTPATTEHLEIWEYYEGHMTVTVEFEGDHVKSVSTRMN
jgi:hypothetical protein